MTLLCASSGADLSEVDYGTHKTLIDSQGHLRFIDVDWKETLVPGAPLIISYHNFEETPTDLEAILSLLQAREASFYKIATMAHSTLDALRMLEFVSLHPKVIGICMGPLGQITRILAPVFGTPLMYASMDELSPVGQVPLETLLNTYHFRNLHPQTPLFGLIGDPIDASIGHLFHNATMKEAVYVKMAVKPSELGSFLAYAKKLNFRGLSVTMPLKEAVIPYLDAIDPEAEKMGAVNTLLFQEGKIKGFNTDGKGALAALGNIIGKKIVIIGAGGASKAIAYALRAARAKVTVANRTPKEGAVLLNQIPGDYDILINTTPHPMPIDPSKIIPGSTVMDIAIKQTTLLQESLAKGCVCISGYPLYLHQAMEQQRIWELNP